jgi:hypothetical protein
MCEGKMRKRKPIMQIRDVLCVAGRSGYMLKDLQAIRAGRTDRIFKRHFSAGPAGAQPPWNTPAAMWRIVFTPRRRWVGQ